MVRIDRPEGVWQGRVEGVGGPTFVLREPRLTLRRERLMSLEVRLVDGRTGAPLPGGGVDRIAGRWMPLPHRDGAFSDPANFREAVLR
jgi:hypothetical protein